MNEDLYKIISGIPQFSNLSEQQLIHDLYTEKLPSLSNSAFKLTLEETSYILKIPQNHSNAYIDRENEKHNAEYAYKLGLSPEVAWSNSKGVSLINYISNARCMTQKDLQDSIVIKKLADTLLYLHDSKVSFKGDVHKPDIILKALNTYYEDCTVSAKQKMNYAYKQGLDAIDRLREFDYPAVPSHIDLTFGNILIEQNEQQRIWLIDWEYSAMASPFWDIATICNQAEFDNIKTAHFLDSICSNKSNFEPSKLQKLLIDYRYILNAVSQCWLAANSNRSPQA